MSLKHIAAGAALAISSVPAFAGVTVNAGAFSEYMFRGVEQSNGAAVQGGVDWSSDAGFYAGTWISNTDFGSFHADSGETFGISYETDVYGGWTKKWGNVGVDVGGLFYYYRDDGLLNTLELYAGVLLGPATIKGYFTNDYFGTDESGVYITANAAIPLTDSVALTPQVGYSFGDGPELFVVSAFDPNPDGGYLDYSLTLSKSIEGFTFSLALVGTDLEDDKQKIVVGLKKTFDL